MKYNTKISLKDAPYMNNFFPFYDPFGEKYLESGEAEEISALDKYLQYFIKTELVTNKT